MNVTYRVDKDILYIALEGRIDATNAAEAEEKIFGIKNENSDKHTVIDADKLEYISSAGLRVILRLRKEEPKLAIINVSSDVYEVFDMTGFTDMVTVEKAYQRMSVEGCEFIAKGANGAVYRYDDETILKTYFAKDALPEIKQERENARKAFVLGINNEEVISMVEKYVGLAQDKSVINFQHMTGGVAWDKMYMQGQALFLHEYLKALPLFRDTELEYGILPMPKLSESQENYYCGFAGYQTAMYCIPADVYDEEISGIISEAMAYHSKELVTPAYYDRTLIGRHVQDPESEETLEIIFANRIYDLGLFYKIGTYGTQLGYLLRDKSTDFASMYTKFEKTANTDLARINGFFQSGNVE